MLKDLSALTPPLLMAAVFLIAAGAFVRHEMRAGRSRAEGESGSESRRDSRSRLERNAADQQSVPRPAVDKPDDGRSD